MTVSELIEDLQKIHNQSAEVVTIDEGRKHIKM